MNRRRMAALGALAMLVVSGACNRTKGPREDNEKTCWDRLDNDKDGKTDCQDSECKAFCDGSVVY